MFYFIFIFFASTFLFFDQNEFESLTIYKRVGYVWPLFLIYVTSNDCEFDPKKIIIEKNTSNSNRNIWNILMILILQILELLYKLNQSLNICRKSFQKRIVVRQFQLQFENVFFYDCKNSVYMHNKCKKKKLIPLFNFYVGLQLI